MNRYFIFALLGVALMCGSVRAETAVQTDQNWGYKDFATTTFALPVASSVYILGVAPGNVASWSTNNPNASFCVLPSGCKGFSFNATGSEVIVGHPNDVASGAYPVGTRVSAGGTFQWSGRNPEQSALFFKVINNGAATAYLMFSGW